MIGLRGSLSLAVFSCLLCSRFSTAADPSTEPATTAPSIQPTAAPVTEGITGDWFGARTRLAEDGITIGGSIAYDYSKNFQGGLSTAKNASRELTNLSVTLTTEQLLGWQGGTFFFNLQDHEGENGTTRLVGDAQVFDSQDGPRFAQISEAWYQQTFADDRWKIKIGRLDANTQFDYVSDASEFLNNSFGNSPTVLALPSYPDPTPGASIFWDPCEHFYLGAGVFDANRDDRSLIFSGHPNNVMPTSDGVFTIMEIGGLWNLQGDDLPGRLGIGGYFHDGRFTRLDGSTQDGAAGMYAVFDQQIWKLGDAGGDESPGIGIFALYGLGDSQVSLIDQHAAAGFAWTGPLPISSRASDILGVGATYAHFSNHANLPNDYELAIEAFYKINITPWFDIQPDLQYIIHPSGNGTPDALVATIRVQVDF